MIEESSAHRRKPSIKLNEKEGQLNQSPLRNEESEFDFKNNVSIA